jgi:hypothetical protein
VEPIEEVKSLFRAACVALLMGSFVGGCAAKSNSLHNGKVYHAMPGREITIRFVPSQEMATAQFRANPANLDNKEVRGFSRAGGDLIVLAAPDFNPDNLAHELYHAMGEAQVDE